MEKELKNKSEKILRNKALAFLGRFLLIFLIGHGVYDYYIRSSSPEVDVLTEFVAHNTADILSQFEDSIATENFPSENPELLPYTTIYMDGQGTISVAHECNGAVVMILFLAFVVAFSGLKRELWWYIPVGFIFIHLANLSRMILLTYLSFNNSSWLHFTHKFLFTALIYLMVFLLWIFWVNLMLKRDKRAKLA